MKPTPLKFHYTFYLRDVAKIIQEIMMTKSLSIQNTDTLAKLWIH